MNLSTILMLFAAWNILSANKSKPREGSKMTDFLSDDAKNIYNCVDKLTSKQSSQEDKTGALFQIISNPSVMELAGRLFNSKQNEQPPSQQNEEGYAFETPSASSQEFFRPIDNIADAEVKHKLYWFYDNWYVK